MINYPNNPHLNIRLRAFFVFIASFFHLFTISIFANQTVENTEKISQHSIKKTRDPSNNHYKSRNRYQIELPEDFASKKSEIIEWFGLELGHGNIYRIFLIKTTLVGAKISMYRSIIYPNSSNRSSNRMSYDQKEGMKLFNEMNILIQLIIEEKVQASAKGNKDIFLCVDPITIENVRNSSVIFMESVCMNGLSLNLRNRLNSWLDKF